MATVHNLLKAHKLRITPFREDVVQAFGKSKYALSHTDLEEILDNPDRITLYRTLKSFEEKGIIHKAIDGTQTIKYALCEDHCTEHRHQDQHTHFHCTLCENTFCLDDFKNPQIVTPSGYRVDSITIILHGSCQKCNQ